MTLPPLSAAELFVHVADGPRILAAYQTLVHANGMAGFAVSNAEAKQKRSAMLNAPDLRQYLPGLGYVSYGQPEITSWSPQGYRLGALMEHARTLATTTVVVPESDLAPWSTVTQTITTADMLAAIATFDLDPAIYDLPTVAAFAVARACTTAVEFPWVVDDTGISRQLPPWPLRRPVDGDPHTLVLSDDKHTPVPCHAWVIDLPLRESVDAGGDTVLLSMAGSAALLKMAKAQWTPRSNRQAAHLLPTDVAKRVNGRVNPRAQWFATGVGTALHTVYVDGRVLQPEMPCFFHITGEDGVPDWTLLFDQLNRALLIPIEYTLIEPLWRAALASDDGLVIPLHSYGCQGYRIQVDQFYAWAALIGQVTDTPTTVTIVGNRSTLEDTAAELAVAA